MAGEERDRARGASDEALAWLVRLSAPDADLTTRADFERWLDEDPTHRAAYDDATALWRKLGPAARRVAARGATRPRMTWRYVLATVAVVLLAALLGPGLLTGLRADHRTADGVRQAVDLADGSTVTLNGGSAIAISSTAAARRVELLAGEAYFAVAPETARPFAVQAGEVRVRVTGTAFNVRRLGDAVTVTVARGSVEVAGPEATARLAAGQAVTVAAGTLGGIEPANLDDALAWRDGRLEFYRERLSDVVAEAARLGAGHLLLRPGLGDQQVSGAILGEDADGFLTTIGGTLGVRALRLPGGVALLY
jgi:transmembrane sensor